MKTLFLLSVWIILISVKHCADSVVTTTPTTPLNTTRIPVNFTCKSSFECNNNGLCNTTSHICICYEEFDTFIVTNSTQSVTMCNYPKKKQLTSFLLSLLVGFGSEHFYLENYPLAIAKLVFYIFCYGMNLILLVLYKFSEKLKPYLEFIGEIEFTYLSCAFISILLWNIYDWVNLINNVYPDGNGISLSAW